MLQAIYFAKSSCLGTKFEEELPEYDGKRAVSDAMVAFIATGVSKTIFIGYCYTDTTYRFTLHWIQST